MLKNLADTMHRNTRLRLASLLAAPLLWLVVAYLGALGALFLTSFWTIDSFTGNIVQQFNLGNFQDVLTDVAYRNVVLRTLAIAVLVTIICAVLAIPMAFYMAKIAKPRSRKVLVALVMTPLWASAYMACPDQAALTSARLSRLAAFADRGVQT